MSRRTPTQAWRRSRTLAIAAITAGMTIGSTIGLSGCSGKDDSQAASVIGGVGGKTIGRGPSITPTPVPKPKRATCSMLSRTAAAKLLGSTATGRADARQWPPGTSELDGCLYLASSGASLQYVVWSTQGGTAATVTPPPVPGNAPVQHFNPGIGQSSTGMVISTGGRITAEVSAFGKDKGRLVQVTTTAPDAAVARRAATKATQTLLSAR